MLVAMCFILVVVVTGSLRFIVNLRTDLSSFAFFLGRHIFVSVEAVRSMAECLVDMKLLSTK
jgi:hypothetical protein